MTGWAQNSDHAVGFGRVMISSRVAALPNIVADLRKGWPNKYPWTSKALRLPEFEADDQQMESDGQVLCRLQWE
jgi:hypothetical protein